ncbi:MAG: radical SAM protein [Candidatus Woesearchaeota archaeon]
MRDIKKMAMTINNSLTHDEKGSPIDFSSKRDCKFRAALGFASEYKYAIETPGFQQIYFMMNSIKEVSCERFYYPEKRLITECAHSNVPILTQETNLDIRDLDITLFSINYEGNYPKMLEMLHWSSIPIFSKDRKDMDNILIAGGICPTYNPKLISDIFDIIVLGEAEPTLSALIRLYIKMKRSNNFSKENFFKEASKIPSVYVPKYCNASDISISNCKKLESPFYTSIVTPKSFHPNILCIEITRGCNMGCKFCVLHKVFSRVRNKDSDDIIRIMKNMRKHTSVLRFVTPSDVYHPDIGRLYKAAKSLKYTVQIGSQRSDIFNVKSDQIFSNTKADFITLAPETALERLRFKIGKTITDEEFYKSIIILSKYRIRKIGLFFIVGFSGENSEDVYAIADMIIRIRSYLDTHDCKNTIIVATINSHIKKPLTIFAKEPQQKISEYFKKVDIIRKRLKNVSNVRIELMDKDTLALECLLVNGGREEMKLLYDIYIRKNASDIVLKDIIGEKLFSDKFKMA